MRPYRPQMDRYEEIIVKSSRLFRENGYPSTSIRDIGNALGVTSAALYYHFKNKDELLLAVIKTAHKNIQQNVHNAIEKETDPGRRIRNAMQAHLRFSVDHQDLAIVYLTEVEHLSEESYRHVEDEVQAYNAMWSTLFADAKESGVIGEHVDIGLLKLLMFGALNLVVTWYRPTGAYTPEQITDELFKYATEGVMPRSIGTIGK